MLRRSCGCAVSLIVFLAWLHTDSSRDTTIHVSEYLYCGSKGLDLNHDAFFAICK